VSEAASTRADADRHELRAGLRAERPFISPKFLYDTLGSRLFAAITELDEYYPTRTEAQIMAAHAHEIVASLGAVGYSLIDLGAGDCRKAARLFEPLKPREYVAVDISEAFLDEALSALKWRFPHIPMHGVGADFSSQLTLPAGIARERRLFFYPGSSIGNFSPDEARAFLGRLREALDESGALLIGVDLIKDVAILEKAYDDSLGVTAAFNLNVLRNANRIAGTNFVPSDWRHLARFNAEHGRVEMHLEARRALVVHFGNPENDADAGELRFRAGDLIHTESSYKYRLETFADLLASAGFGVKGCWTDPQQAFAVVLAGAG
jgi:dimethylhistidine N-methyltransferase